MLENKLVNLLCLCNPCHHEIQSFHKYYTVTSELQSCSCCFEKKKKVEKKKCPIFLDLVTPACDLLLLACEVMLNSHCIILVLQGFLIPTFPSLYLFPPISQLSVLGRDSSEWHCLHYCVVHLVKQDIFVCIYSGSQKFSLHYNPNIYATPIKLLWYY